VLVGRVGQLSYEFWFQRHGQVIRPGTWFRDLGKGRRDVLRDVRDTMPKPPGEGASQPGVGKPRKASQVFVKLKEVASFLTDVTYPDGTPIGNVQLSLRTRGPLVQAQLKIAGLGGLKVSVEDSNVDEALLALEAALQSEPVPWEPDPFPLDGGGHKKKK